MRTCTYPWHALLLLLFLLFCSSMHGYAECLLPAPQDLKPKNIASCYITVKWKLVPGAVSYSIQYKNSSGGAWISLNKIGNVDAYTINGLTGVTSYQVKVASNCAVGGKGIFSIPIVVTTLVCTEPINFTASGITATSVHLSWSMDCAAPKFSVRYRKAGTLEWFTIKNIPATEYNFNGLEQNTTYEMKVESKCSGGDSEYSPSIFFTTLAVNNTKNVLLIIIDDARFDSHAATGGPSFFNDVNISRIANEGVNFTKGFVTFSLCAPSRGTMITGLYPHLHGITDNVAANDNATITGTTIAEILQNHGYYTGLIGKYHISSLPQQGFNYWLESHNKFYFNSKFNVNGVEKTLPGHITDVVTDSAISFIHKVPAGQPFFLWLGYKAPHTPPVPRTEDEGLFDSFEMPFPSNYEKYEENVPEFLYDCHSYADSTYIENYYRGYYELLNGVETRLGDIFNELSAMNILDSTLIIFISDNGYLLGEHLLLEKQLAHEESIHVPIFMRYPPLIPAGTVVNDQIALNLDIAPTILDFAGIEDTFGMQGLSMLKLANGSETRSEMMYEFFNKDCVPDTRGVRSLSYKYIQYYCPEATEEFFDLILDPKENTNLVNDPAYAVLVNQYRDKLTFLRNYYEDFTWDSLYNCSLINPQRLVHSEDEPLSLFHIYPNPASTEISIHFISEEKTNGEIQIINVVGKVVYHKLLETAHTDFSASISTASLPPGNYVTVMQHGLHTYRQIFVKQ
ncbi:MAG: sulfatase-like hydrolase/transferase [Chitinophagales bacterium]